MSRHAITERYPLAPLLELEGCGFSELARRLRIDDRQLHRWKHDGIPATSTGRYDADRVALELGHMPHEVWADWYERCPVAS